MDILFLKLVGSEILWREFIVVYLFFIAEFPSLHGPFKQNWSSQCFTAFDPHGRGVVEILEFFIDTIFPA